MHGRIYGGTEPFVCEPDLRLAVLSDDINNQGDGYIGEPPEFRILAPEFMCPKDEEAPQTKPDNTIITLRAKAGVQLSMRWSVRWTPLPAPTQRCTLLLWRATRALEKKLNGPQPEPFVYVIENDELLRGVNYIFNVTASNSNGEETPKSFHIDNVSGEQELVDVEGRPDMLSILLVGGQETYADVEFTMEAQVTTCYPTQDYDFQWSVQSTDTEDKVEIALTGSRLEIPAYSVRAGLTYLATCQVVRHSNGDFITQNSLPFTVLRRTFKVYLNVDRLTVPTNTPFAVESIVLNHDYFDEALTYKWECTYDDNECKSFDSADNDTMYFVSGLPTAGEYRVSLSVSVAGHSASASAVIVAVPRSLPVIQVSPLPRVLNEGTAVSLVANASNVTPTCSLTWYFATTEYLQLQSHVVNDTCDDCQHGKPLADTLTINSLEENFLYDLTDFTNETEWRQVTADMPAAAGRARFVVRCGCTLALDCDSEGTVSADMVFDINKISQSKNVMVSPETGTALETLFRISTLAMIDSNSPLYYSFYCRVDFNSSLLLGAYAEHLTVETILPYFEEGTEIWVEICDVLGACSRSASKIVNLSAGDGATVPTVLEEARAHIRRCELLQLQRVAVAAAVTYRNAGQTEALSEFCSSFLKALTSANDDCLQKKPELYYAFLTQLTEVGCDVTF